MPIAHYNKGVILASEGDYTSALLALSRAIELKPDFGEAYYNLGIVPSYNLLKRMSAK